MNRMFRLLKENEIDCRVATVSEKGCSLLLYKDARVDQNVLDETVGPFFWQRKHEIIDGNLYCSVGIYSPDLDSFVWKQDVGVESYTEKEKGQASDAFKRACFNWGIGRELYTAPFIWVPAARVNLTERSGKYTTYDRFAVTQIGYKDDAICRLTIINERTKAVVFAMGAETEEEKMIDRGKEKLNETDLKAVRSMLKRLKKTEESICEYFKIGSLEEMTVENMSTLTKIIEDAKKKKEDK